MSDQTYSRAGSVAQAAALSVDPGAVILAGGTTLLDLIKCDVARPATLVDITHLSGLDEAKQTPDGVTIGALMKMSHAAEAPAIRAAYPAISQSLLLAASAQLRNMATIGGNVLQKTRCAYFRDPEAYPACNKRNPGSGCSALDNVTRNEAVLGTSDACIAVYPGDLAVALAAFDAVVKTDHRDIPVADFFLLPGETPERETVLEAGEIITGIFVPASPAAKNSTYLKVRERASYEFAAASAAVGLAFEDDGRTIRDIHVAIGGVATRPWRCTAVEEALRGQIFDEQAVREASRLAVEGAVARGANAYKIDLAPRVVARAILQLGGRT
ncbi:FAD binding domain-containing protein [Rhizobium halophytocola]|uniref:Xanthine dehydrogenase YagS FAD-binding subunit n=1 Tax=Rhizobium halophytocola TaxID=735519 RepID=A0ABS4DZV3_9HYPH|nr:xanthine dehydrogenase family protein subunit M [Rhizobium halophytocola]MBP1851179.1 xanthine dehydrogenase YagS FAD-binding subunit [Rhizobium halophytocola]